MRRPEKSAATFRIHDSGTSRPFSRLTWMFRLTWMLVVFGGLVLGCLWGTATLLAQGPQARPGYLVDGRREVMQVVWQDEQWQATTSDGEDASAAMVQWGRLIERWKPTLMLTHGEVVVDFLELDEQHLTIGRDPYSFSQRPLWAKQKLSRGSVRGFVMQWPSEQQAQDQLRNAIKESAESDRVWFVDGEFVDGRVVESLGEDSRVEEIKVVRGGREILIPTRRIRALRFATRDLVDEGADERADKGADVREKDEREKDERSDVVPARWQVGFQDGTILDVARVSETAAIVDLELPDSLRLHLPSATFRRSVCFLRPHRQDVLWLGDQEPLDVRHMPFFTGTWRLARNKNLWGGRLRERGQWHDRGLAMHSTTRVAYDLDGGEQVLQARLALDPSAGQAGSVRYFVFSRQDVDSPWKENYKSPVIRGSDSPIDISVPIGPATQLALIVEYADDGDVLDRACWFDARLVHLVHLVHQ